MSVTPTSGTNPFWEAGAKWRAEHAHLYKSLLQKGGQTEFQSHLTAVHGPAPSHREAPPPPPVPTPSNSTPANNSADANSPAAPVQIPNSGGNSVSDSDAISVLKSALVKAGVDTSQLTLSTHNEVAWYPGGQSWTVREINITTANGHTQNCCTDLMLKHPEISVVEIENLLKS